MPAYFIVFRDEMKNADQYEAYRPKAVASFAGHDAKGPVANGALTPLEGAAPDGVVVLEFPTVEAAKAWYNSPAYQAAVKILGDGELTKKLKITAHRFSQSALAKIEKCGGQAIVIPGKKPVVKGVAKHAAKPVK